MKAIRIDKTEEGSRAAYVDMGEAELMEGDLTIRVLRSSLNYKDGLALTGRAPVVRRFPMIPGIDLFGVVESSSHAGFSKGDRALVTGWGLGETHFGGYAQKARVKGDWAVAPPPSLDAGPAMALGTAGLTAMLCLLALERHGLAPDRGPLLVTGAAGGVGSIAVMLAARAGWRVIASTGRQEHADFLRELGAEDVIDRAELAAPSGRPLGKERFAAAIDVAGSHTLANALAQTVYGGAVAACGLAQGMDLGTSVAPFILRNVSLLGIDSVMCPQPLRRHAWDRLARDIDFARLEGLTRTISLADAIGMAEDILAGRVRGRTVVEIPG